MVSSYKYLGIIFNSRLSSKDDILKSEASFLKQFYCIYRKFKFASQQILIFLFISHCMSLYGTEMWYELKGSHSAFKYHAVNYHRCIKKIINVPWYESNHKICEETGLLLFKHLINWKNLCFICNLLNAKSASISCHRYYIAFYSDILTIVQRRFQDIYSIDDILNNDLDAIRSRIIHVQNREERSHFNFMQ